MKRLTVAYLFLVFIHFSHCSDLVVVENTYASVVNPDTIQIPHQSQSDLIFNLEEYSDLNTQYYLTLMNEALLTMEYTASSDQVRVVDTLRLQNFAPDFASRLKNIEGAHFIISDLDSNLISVKVNSDLKISLVDSLRLKTRCKISEILSFENNSQIICYTSTKIFDVEDYKRGIIHPAKDLIIQLHKNGNFGEYNEISNNLFPFGTFIVDVRIVPLSKTSAFVYCLQNNGFPNFRSLIELENNQLTFTDITSYNTTIPNFIKRIEWISVLDTPTDPNLAFLPLCIGESPLNSHQLSLVNSGFTKSTNLDSIQQNFMPSCSLFEDVDIPYFFNISGNYGLDYLGSVKASLVYSVGNNLQIGIFLGSEPSLSDSFGSTTKKPNLNLQVFGMSNQGLLIKKKLQTRYVSALGIMRDPSSPVHFIIAGLENSNDVNKITFTRIKINLSSFTTDNCINPEAKHLSLNQQNKRIKVLLGNPTRQSPDELSSEQKLYSLDSLKYHVMENLDQIWIVERTQSKFKLYLFDTSSKNLTQYKSFNGILPSGNLGDVLTIRLIQGVPFLVWISNLHEIKIYNLISNSELSQSNPIPGTGVVEKFQANFISSSVEKEYTEFVYVWFDMNNTRVVKIENNDFSLLPSQPTNKKIGTKLQPVFSQPDSYSDIQNPGIIISNSQKYGYLCWFTIKNSGPDGMQIFGNYNSFLSLFDIKTASFPLFLKEEEFNKLKEGLSLVNESLNRSYISYSSRELNAKYFGLSKSLASKFTTNEFGKYCLTSLPFRHTTKKHGSFIFGDDLLCYID